MQRISITALEARWQEIIRAMPELKRAAFADLGPEILAEVREEIGGSGKVQDWQEYQVGSRGGYVAVRPRAKTYHASRSGGKKYAVGYITNAINSGHKQNAGQFIPGLVTEDFWGNFSATGAKLKEKWIPGKHFYEHAAERSEELIRRAVGRLEQSMKELVEQ
ncbi:MAG: hypothetical protein ACLSE7_00880 [Lachnospirales bacterium]